MFNIANTQSQLIMGKKSDLQSHEKAKIINLLAEGVPIPAIANQLQRDKRTILSFTKNASKIRKRVSNTKFNKINSRQMTTLKRTLSKLPLSTSRTIFTEAGIDVKSRTTRCRILRSIAKVKSASKRPPLSKKHEDKRVEWAKRYMKLDFQTVIFTDECRASLDGPDGWARGWISNGSTTPTRLKRQQGGGGCMFWAGLHGSNLIGPFRIQEGIKIDSAVYCQLLNDKLMPYVNSFPQIQRNKIVLMQDNAPSHASNFTKTFLEGNGFSGKRLMDWPSASPDLNPIENYWSVFKRLLYDGNKQYSNTEQLWNAIITTFASMDKGLIKKLTSSMDNRLYAVLSKNGKYIGH